MKQIEVTILGQSYLLGCPEGGEALLHKAVARVDQEMSGIRDAGKVKARERMAVLAALNLAYQLAERHIAPPAAPLAKAGPAAKAALAAPIEGSEGETIEALVRRIDTALGDDGHLL
jgi:cell division protein ZapA